MISATVIRTVVGILGNIISLVLFLSPLKTFVNICKKGSVEQFSSMPYLATIFNCGMWILYGLPMFHPNAILVLTINGTGFVIEAVFLVLYLVYSDSKKQRLKLGSILAGELGLVAVVGLLVGTLVKSVKQRTTIIGSVCMVGCFLMYAAPLSVMRMVITTKSVKYMPFLLSLFSFLNGLCWTCYALIGQFDPYILAPNGLGALLGAAQLILYATYYKSSKAQELELPVKNNEVGLAQITTAPALPSAGPRVSKPV
ncbi:Bidirectional sugar transporter SWEET [Heracleum sosnowskyi]|uniref:Bidirectional sugar transporter SWEET n=1 Tax=Heracleum sosnowskyi TaxID=360622 RepID=A0AAD8GMN3_9APIA|nr:Bidirectional sugar transporter SWEET [Heracleum sosnowskyi]